MTLDRYLLREVGGPFLTGWVLLTAVFAAYAASLVMADVASGTLTPRVVTELVLLRCLVGAEVIVPTSLFFAVLFAFERLNRDRELVAFLAGGCSRLRLLRPVATASLVALALVALLSLQARPWAYRTIYAIEDVAARPDVAAMEAGRFYGIESDLVITAGDVDVDDNRLEDVFARQQRLEGLRVIRSEAAFLSPMRDDGSQVVEFRDGQALTLPQAGGGGRRYRFERLRYRWPGVEGDGGYRNRRAEPTGFLARSAEPKDVAELQWRFTLPWLALGMTLVAGALGTMKPGAVTSVRMLTAIAAYVLVFNVAAAARTAVENAVVPPIPGIWWLPLLPLVVFVIVLVLARRGA